MKADYLSTLSHIRPHMVMSCGGMARLIDQVFLHFFFDFFILKNGYRRGRAKRTVKKNRKLIENNFVLVEVADRQLQDRATTL